MSKEGAEDFVKSSIEIQEGHEEAAAEMSLSERPTLLQYVDPNLPPHLRFNKYVWGHYRPPMGIAGCLNRSPSPNLNIKVDISSDSI